MGICGEKSSFWFNGELQIKKLPVPIVVKIETEIGLFFLS
jgi:hypothetical protein